MTEPAWIPLGASPAGSAWMTGDTKVSMQAASHDDPSGGRWLLADGSAIPGQYTALIGMCGANLPDAKGRGLVMLGTNADVNALGKSDGIALASRSPKHKSSVSVSDPGHAHSMPSGGYYTADQFREFYTARVVRDDVAATNVGYTGIGVTVGPGASAMIDTGSFVVVGNLFVHT